jgi:hypothetical protein
VKSIEDSLRLTFNNTQESFGWTFWLPTTLLPILKSSDAYSNHVSKFRLGESQLISQRSHINLAQSGAAMGDWLPSHDGSHLVYALNELLEIFIIHWCSQILWLMKIGHPHVCVERTGVAVVQFPVGYSGCPGQSHGVNAVAQHEAGCCKE